MIANPDRVERLADYLSEVAAECFELEDVTAADVISAQCTVLARTLRGLRKFEEPAERFSNAKQIHTVLTDLLIEFGRVPS